MLDDIRDQIQALLGAKVIQPFNLLGSNVQAVMFTESDATVGWITLADLSLLVTPSGAAGGDLTGTYPNPTIATGAVTSAKILDGTITGTDIATGTITSSNILDETITDTDIASANKDGTTTTPSLRTLGTGATQACAGNDSRLSDARTPTGSAGGDLAGTYPNPTIKSSVGLTGTPTAPTASQGTNTTQIATTAYVQTEAGLLIPKSLVDAKGDLIVGTADNTVARIAAGSNGRSLVADSAQTAGVKWSFASNPTVKVYLSAALNHTSTGNFQTIGWDAELFDTDSMHSTSVNTSRLIAPVDGKYQITAYVGFNNQLTPTGKRYAAFYFNGGVTALSRSDAATLIASDNASVQTTITISMAANQYVEVVGFQNTGGNFAYVVGNPETTAGACWASMTLLSA